MHDQITVCFKGHLEQMMPSFIYLFLVISLLTLELELDISIKL